MHWNLHDDYVHFKQAERFLAAQWELSLVGSGLVSGILFFLFPFFFRLLFFFHLFKTSWSHGSFFYLDIICWICRISLILIFIYCTAPISPESSNCYCPFSSPSKYSDEVFLYKLSVDVPLVGTRLQYSLFKNEHLDLNRASKKHLSGVIAMAAV